MLSLPKIRTYLAEHAKELVPAYDALLASIGKIQGDFKIVANSLAAKAISIGHQNLAEAILAWKYHVYNLADSVPSGTDVIWC